MKYGLYSVRDDLNGFMFLTTENNDESAKRGFMYKLSIPNSFDGYAAKDLNLFKVGLFDQETGQITPIDPPQLIQNGYVAKQGER